MIALTAYGVKKGRQAYQKRKAEKSESQKLPGQAVGDPSDELNTPADEESLNRASSTATRTTTTSSGSEYSQPTPADNSQSQRDHYSQGLLLTGSTNASRAPINEQEYQQYLSRQSHRDLQTGPADEPPSYDMVVGQIPLTTQQPSLVQQHVCSCGQVHHADLNSHYAQHSTHHPSSSPYPAQPTGVTMPLAPLSEMQDTGSYRQPAASWADSTSSVNPVSRIGGPGSQNTQSSLSPRDAVAELPGGMPARNVTSMAELPAELPPTKHQGELPAELPTEGSTRVAAELPAEKVDDSSDSESRRERATR